ncbi:MAG: hypothetical protein MZW92_81555 [Comamonadaceae bacterium]|nr:hypothetical protein [Comamonadaceae bacterium]
MMSFSVTLRAHRPGVQRPPISNTLFAQRRNLLQPSFCRMLRDILRFNRAVAGAARPATTRRSPSDDYLRAQGYSPGIHRALHRPHGRRRSGRRIRHASLQFPARLFVQLLQQPRPAQRQRPATMAGDPAAARGSYVEPLTAPFRDRMRLNRRWNRVRRHADRRRGHSRGGGRAERFDQVIIATHSDQALALLADPSPARARDSRARSPTRTTRRCCTPTPGCCRRRQGPGPAGTTTCPRQPRARVAVTYDMNMLQSLGRAGQLSASRSTAATPSIRHASCAAPTYHHPVFTRPPAFAAQARREEISGVNRTWYCGAYWGYGFHEDGVNSALAVCRAVCWSAGRLA